jgi:hypothetical protein
LFQRLGGRVLYCENLIAAAFLGSCAQ